MKKIILAIDSFKGCLTSEEVEQAAQKGILDVYPDCEVVSVPIADGGEGMLDIMVRATHGKYMEVEVHDPLMRTIVAHYGVTGDGQTAIIEMAQASGLPLLSMDERHPMETTSYGTGELIAHAISAGYRQLLVGIGGSATNDAGMGMMQALGDRFYDRCGKKLSTGCGKLLDYIEYVDLEDFNRCVSGVCFATACDVNNPFCGEDGAAVVFAPQKGANAEEVALLDMGMNHFSQVISTLMGRDLSKEAGTGAAGGVGGALSAFFHSTLQPGIELMLEKLDFENKIKDADLLITGEGKADCQTLMGKVPAGILQCARRQNLPVALMAGAIADVDVLKSAGFYSTYAVTPTEMPLSEAMKADIAKKNIRATAAMIVKDYASVGRR